MTRTFRALGPLTLAALVVAATAASSAQAEPHFEADKYKATVHGTALSASVFSFGGSLKWECKNSKFQGELASSSPALRLFPEYVECTWTSHITEKKEGEGEKPSVVFVTMNGCDFRFHGLEFLAKDEYRALADLECPTGKLMTIDLFHESSVLCTLTVGAQSSLSDLKLIDQTGKEETADDDVKAQITIEKLHYTQDSLGCPVKQGNYENLQYLGENTLTAITEAGEPIGLRVSGE
jgi:hypothetical protein